jgi:hypothetical protein
MLISFRKGISQKMHNKLTPTQQDEIELTSNFLLQVTEDIYNLKNGSKNFLIEIKERVS